MSNFQLTGAGNPIPSLQLVATDQTTIFGDGSGQNPLRTGAGGVGQVEFSQTGTGPMFQVGWPVIPGGSSNTGYVASAPLAGASRVPPSGLISKFGADGNFFQTSGELTLTTAEWDARVTGQSGGLTAGQAYYVDGGVIGNLSTVQIGAQVGLAISPTTMLIQIGACPDTLNLANNAVTVGMGVVVDEPSSTAVFSPAPNPGSTGGRVDGVAAFVGSGKCVAALEGQIVTLTTGQWDAIAGTSGGLAIDTPYYASSATAGHLTSAKPAGTGTYVTQIGIGLSTTQLLVSLGTPIGPHS